MRPERAASGRVPRPAVTPAPPPPRAGQAGTPGLAQQTVGLEQAANYTDLAGNPNAEGLDGFALGTILGQGPTGLTYDGIQKASRVRVAIKVLNPRFATQPDLVAEVREDLGGYEQSGVPGAPLAVGKTHGNLVVVYPYLPGQVLTGLLKGGPAEARSALEILRSVAVVLAPAHELGLGHGDVRSAKIICGDQGAGLADFGLARAACLASAFGQRGMTFGHPGYLAPEVLQEDQLEPTPVADVYALGIVLYELLCARQPFLGSVEDVLSQHLDASLPPPPAGVQISKGVAQLLLNMTAKSPAGRLRNARTVVDAVDALLSGQRGIVTREAWSVASQAEADQSLWASTESAPLANQLPDLSDALMRSSGRIPREVLSDLMQEEKEKAGKAGAQKGKFSLGELIGRGPIGRTCEGSLGDRPVAVKVISAKFDQHPQVVQTLLDRAVEAQGLDHPNLVRSIQVIRAKNRTLILQERVQGVTLAQFLSEQGSLEVNQALGFMREVAQALGHAHAQKVAHGDVRTEKIFVEAGRARLSDFGFAQANCLGAGFGRHGLPFGHPNYTAPEVFQAPLTEPDPLCDVYGLGITLYESICGKLPFSGEPGEVMRKHLSRPIPPPPAEARVPDAVADLILKLTAKDRARRPQTAEAVVEAIDRAAKQASEASSSGDGPLVEEFDPTQDLLSMDDWGQLVASVPKVTGRWSKDRIKKAQAVGPKDWDERSLAEGSAEQTELRKALEAAVADNANKASTKGTKRVGAAPAIGNPEPSGNRLSFIASVGGIAVVVLAMIGGAIYTAVKSDQPPKNEARPDWSPPVEVQEERDEAAALEKRVKQKVEKFETSLQSELKQRNFKRALDLFEALPEEIRQSGHAQQKLLQAELKVSAAIAEAMLTAQERFKALIQNGALSLAERELKLNNRNEWAKDDPTYKAMKSTLERTRAARLRQLGSLPSASGKSVDVSALRRELRKTVEGVPIETVLDNGGVVVRYSGDDLEALLETNSTIKYMKSAKLRPAPSGQGMAIYLEPHAGKRGVLQHKLPLIRPLDATVEFIMDGKRRPLSAVGVVTGFTNKRLRGHGMSWGIGTLDYRVKDDRYNVNLRGTQDALLELKPNVVLRMSYSLSPLSRDAERLQLSGSLSASGERHMGNSVPVFLKQLSGHTLITLYDVKGWIVSFEVRGIFDPSYKP